jgi:thiamine biosynthesis lipoprotein
MQRLEFRAMGSSMLAALDVEHTAPTLEVVPGWFEEWEQVLSRFRIDSELSTLNAHPGIPQTVSQTMWEVLQAALVAQDLTGGLVNPLILDALVHVGYDRPFDLIERECGPEQVQAGNLWSGEAAVAEPLPALGSIVSDSKARTICIPAGYGLDLGGVAKGWAAHQAMHRLAPLGPTLVSAGGDIAVSRPLATGEPWRIGLEDPFQRERHVEMLYLESGGVATSGKDHRTWRRSGLLQHHIIDPRTLLPASTDIQAATVIAPTVMQAEALAKAVLISGSEAGLEMIDGRPEVEAILVLDSGKMRYSANIETYL